MDLPALQRLAPPAITLLVAFLAYSSQYLFHRIEPGPLRPGDAYLFNALVASLLICYWRTCFTDPGRIPRDWWEGDADEGVKAQRQRWCRKCETFKPPRAHHCKACKRCIPKMDHHCVWTANCVSHVTLPHFVRFLAYAVASMLYLETFLYARCAVIWQKRHLPSYLGPTVPELTHLFLLTVTNTLVLISLLLLLARTLYSLALNQTTIESWELDRHAALLRRARTLGGFLYCPDGSKLYLTHQEFPWDVGIARNISQAFGTWNPIFWLWPFARSPRTETGLRFEHNGIEDPRKPWPPPDPDRMFRAPAHRPVGGGEDEGFTGEMDVAAFRARQERDLMRLARGGDGEGEGVVRRRPFHERLEGMVGVRGDAGGDGDVDVAVEEDGEGYSSSSSEDMATPSRGAKDRGGKGRVVRGEDDAGEEGWRNREGERLADFGVDEVAEFYDEDDLPLGEILRRRRMDREQGGGSW